MHPPSWRKPCPRKSINNNIFPILTKQNQILYLSIQNKLQGRYDLGCNTRYDWYILQKVKCNTHTHICDEYNVTNIIYLPFYNWLPNSNIKNVMNLVTKRGEERIQVLYDRMAYKADQNNLPLEKQWVSKYENDTFPFPLIHSTPKKGIQYRFSSVCDRGHFGIPKLIFGEGGIHHCILDMNGEYGMTHGAIGIIVDNNEEAITLKNILLSTKFKKLIDACCFSSYRIDWNVLAQFSKQKLLEL